MIRLLQRYEGEYSGNNDKFASAPNLEQKTHDFSIQSNSQLNFRYCPQSSYKRISDPKKFYS